MLPIQRKLISFECHEITLNSRQLFGTGDHRDRVAYFKVGGGGANSMEVW